MGGSRGGDRGSRPLPGIARLLIFAMLKFSVRPLLGIWTPRENFLDPRMAFVISRFSNLLGELVTLIFMGVEKFFVMSSVFLSFPPSVLVVGILNLMLLLL